MYTFTEIVTGEPKCFQKLLPEEVKFIVSCYVAVTQINIFKILGVQIFWENTQDKRLQGRQLQLQQTYRPYPSLLEGNCSVVLLFSHCLLLAPLWTPLWFEGGGACASQAKHEVFSGLHIIFNLTQGLSHLYTGAKCL